MSIRLGVVGALGRMGQAIVLCAQKEADMVVVGATVEPGSPWAGKPLAEALPGAGEVLLTDNLEKLLSGTPVDAVIDFSTPSSTAAHAAVCAKAKVALVTGTTGLSEAEQAVLEAAAKEVPVLWAPNMSVGVQVLSLAVREVARRLGPKWNVEVLEIHHKMKKDAPSGTALKLAEEAALALGLGKEKLKLARCGLVGERPEGEIGVQSLRGGQVVGEHTVFFFGEGERLELKHCAQSREQFALGALRAARWLQAKPAGFYGMGDLLS